MISGKEVWQNWSEDKRRWMLFLGVCLFLELLFIPRAFFGFNTADEMYFAGTSERIFRGERILIDEWNPTQQMTAFCIHPLYCLLRTVLGSTEGIIMAVRLSYLVLHLAAALFIFWKLRKKSWGAAAAVLLFFMFSPFGIFTLSYNSIQFAVLFMLIACLYSKQRHKAWEYIFYGVMCAVIVLANPFAILLYGLYGFLCLGAEVWSRIKKREITEVLRLKSFLLMSLGAALVALLFAVFVLGRGNVKEILANVPHIIGDSEHEQGGIRTYLKKTRRYFYLCYKNYKYMVWGYGILYLASLIDKNSRKRAALYLGLGLLFLMPYLIYYGFISQHITVNYQMMPLAFLGLEAYILTKNRDKRLFICGFLLSVLYTMAVQYATNTGIVTISVAYGVTSMISVIFIWDCGKEIWEQESVLLKKRLAVGFLAAALILQFAGTLYLRLTFAWGDGWTWRMDTQMERGPLKGVYTMKEQAEEYSLVLRELDSLNLTEEDELLVVGVAPWIYLYADAGCGSYSTWQVHENSVQLVDYYALHPDKFPNVVYMMHWAEQFMDSSLMQPFTEKGYEVVYLERGTVLLAPDRENPLAMP